MAHFNQELGGLGVPVTLSSLSGRFLKKIWREQNYKGYQISPIYYIGDTSSVQTPKGLFSSKDIGLKMSLFIGNFKGGRNECFMYGIDDKTLWYDFDIISAYTTVMALIGDPDYAKLKTLSVEELSAMSESEILYSFIIIQCTFKFPNDVKYPSIGCFIDESTTVYPLSGQALLTGSEYLLALSQNCTMQITEIIHVPFKQETDLETGITHEYKPFLESITQIQKLRSEHKKGTILNALYKELGNSQYGLTARGISGKKRYDIKVGKSVKLDVNEFANPLISG